MSDLLAEFILEGDSREVDAWWAEKGLGCEVAWQRDFGEPYPYCDCRRKNRRRRQPHPHGIWTDEDQNYAVIQNWTSDDANDRQAAHASEIEDRIDEVCVGVNYAYFLSELTRQWDRDSDWMLIRATNRQRILAAARAMELTYA